MLNPEVPNLNPDALAFIRNGFHAVDFASWSHRCKKCDSQHDPCDIESCTNELSRIAANSTCEGCDRPYNGLKDSKGRDYCPCSEPDCDWPVHEHGEEHDVGPATIWVCVCCDTAFEEYPDMPIPHPAEVGDFGVEHGPKCEDCAEI